MYAINNRELSIFSHLATELSYEPLKNYLFDLSYLGGIQVAGEKAKEFLQGQLSCDVREVTEKQIQQGALCNLKGRILALVDVIDWKENGVHLILPLDLLEETKASLNKTAMFSKVTLNQDHSYQFFGFYLQDPENITPFNLNLPIIALSAIRGEDFYAYCLGNNFYIFMVKKNKLAEITEPFIQRSQWRGSYAWHVLQLEKKRIDIYPESRGLFLPHRLGLQLSGYLSFDKGCYKGQEIIARTHYRAKLKHELKLFKIQTKEALNSGQKLFAANDDIEIGELVDYCSIGNDLFLIAASVLLETPDTVRFEGHKNVVTLTN